MRRGRGRCCPSPGADLLPQRQQGGHCLLVLHFPRARDDACTDTRVLPRHLHRVFMGVKLYRVQRNNGFYVGCVIPPGRRASSRNLGSILSRNSVCTVTIIKDNSRTCLPHITRRRLSVTGDRWNIRKNAFLEPCPRIILHDCRGITGCSIF